MGAAILEGSPRGACAELREMMEGAVAAGAGGAGPRGAGGWTKVRGWLERQEREGEGTLSGGNQGIARDRMFRKPRYPEVLETGLQVLGGHRCAPLA